MGLQRPSNGQLKVDGELVCDKNMRQWQTRLAHVPQSIYIADCTIAENIAFGIPLCEIDFDKVYQVAKDAQISETINKFPKYLTLVGERGIRLSGGQLQRIE